MVKQTQTIRWQQPTSYLSVFDHFVGLALNERISPSRPDPGQSEKLT